MQSVRRGGLISVLSLHAALGSIRCDPVNQVVVRLCPFMHDAVLQTVDFSHWNDEKCDKLAATRAYQLIAATRSKDRIGATSCMLFAPSE